MFSNYSGLIVCLMYFLIILVLDFKATGLLAESDKGLSALFFTLVVIQIGLGPVFVALAVDPKSGRNR